MCDYGEELGRAETTIMELQEHLKRAGKLCRLLTLRQIIDAGDDAIKASGLNPYCLNEGADPNERFDAWWLDP